MEPSEIRNRVLEDHEKLRGELQRLEGLKRAAGQPEASPHDAVALRACTEAFLGRLRRHMAWEERYLLPALREADAWGEERAVRLLDDHREQVRLLDFVIERLHDEARPDALVVRDVGALVAFLLVDMDEEERDLLDPRVLRDDVIAIDLQVG